MSVERAYHLQSTMLGPRHTGTPTHAPSTSLGGIPRRPRGWGLLPSVFPPFFPEKNGTIVQAPAPHPPHGFLCFLLPLGWLPAPAPAPVPSLAQLPAREERAGGGRVLGEEGARDCAPPHQALVPSQSLGGGAGKVPSASEPGIQLHRPSPRPELLSVGLGWGESLSLEGGGIRQETMA